MRFDLTDDLRRFRERYPTFRPPLVRALAFDDAGARLLVATPPALLVFDLATGARVAEVSTPYDPPWVDEDALADDEDEGGEDFTEPETQWITGVEFVPGGAELIAREVTTQISNQGETTRQLELYRLADGQHAASRPTEEQWEEASAERYSDQGVTAFAFSPDGSRLAASRAMGEVRVERVRGDGELAEESRAEGPEDQQVLSLAWDARGVRLAARYESAVVVYEVSAAGMRETRRVKSRAEQATVLAWGAGDALLLAGNGAVWRLPPGGSVWEHAAVRGAKGSWPFAVAPGAEQIYWGQFPGGQPAGAVVRLQREVPAGPARRLRNRGGLQGELDALAISPGGMRVARASGAAVVLSRLAPRARGS